MPETKRLKLLVLRITERCNLACDYCYAGKARGGDMPLSTALKAVEGAVGPGEAIKIQFTGGEPLLNAGIIEAVYDFGRDTGRRLKLAIQTNGTLLTIKNCLLLKKTGCSVGVSLDGTGEMNGRRRYPNGRQAFADACKGIMNLRDCGMMCALMSVVTSANAASLDRLLDLAFYLGNVYGVGLDIFRELGRGEGKAGELKASVDAFASGLDAMLLKHGEYAKKGINIHIRELDRYRRLMRRPAREAGGAYCYIVDSALGLFACSVSSMQPPVVGVPQRVGRAMSYLIHAFVLGVSDAMLFRFRSYTTYNKYEDRRTILETEKTHSAVFQLRTFCRLLLA